MEAARQSFEASASAAVEEEARRAAQKALSELETGGDGPGGTP
jgi:hypothetical protein